MGLSDMALQTVSLKLRFASAIVGLTVGLSACAPMVDQRGYVPDPEKLSTLRAGIDNKLSVTSRLGSPSSMATFDASTWYYISSEQAQFAFFKARTTKREIVQIHFDIDNLVDEVTYYDLADGQQINFVERETPTRGKELTFLEQIFGNVGRFDSSTLGGEGN
jgi:outer membrane protein assembly factor BamE (lipoprotein component of BamABCDE complex)